MKKIFLIIVSAIVSVISISAQSLKDIDPSLLPKGVYIEGDSVRVNLDEVLSDSLGKKVFLEVLNQKYRGKDKDVIISDYEHVNTNGNITSGIRKANGLPFVKNYMKYTYSYTSVDVDNQPITLSGALYIPGKWQANFQFDALALESTDGVLSILASVETAPIQILKVLLGGVVDGACAIFEDQIQWGILSCHPTVTSDTEAPSGSLAPEASFAQCMPAERCMIVCPDYCGYGFTKKLQHPYLVQDITARNCVDGYLTAIDIAKRIVGGDDMKSASDGFFTHIIGYSQGGSVALACAKYIDSGLLSDAQKAKINLKATFCGDGPYCPQATLQQYLTWANSDDVKYNHLAYPCVLPLICTAAKQYHDKGCMRTVKTEDYFAEDFLKTGIIQNLESKEMTTAELNDITKEHKIFTIDKMMSSRMIYKDPARHDSLFYNTESNEYKCLMKALDKADLTKGWTPKEPVYFFHYKGDLVVPYANMTPIFEKMKNDWKDKVKFIEAETGFKYLQSSWYLGYKFVDGETDKSKWDHVTVGTLFYVWYMSDCPCAPFLFWRTSQW